MVIILRRDVGDVIGTVMEDVVVEPPMASASDKVKDKIWGLILMNAYDTDHQELELGYNAMVIDLPGNMVYVDWEEITHRNLQWKSLKTTRWALPLVSKSFNVSCLIFFANFTREVGDLREFQLLFFIPIQSYQGYLR